jgi:putative membrane protein
MKPDRIRIITLGAVLLSPVALFAQSDPFGTAPASSTQPNQQQRQQPATTSMQDSGANAGDTGQIMKDKMFLRTAAEGGIAEVQFGQLAAQKASSDDVKAFGQKMVDDHTMLNKQMASVADSMGIMLPKQMNKADQAEYDKLNALSGNDFDVEYLTIMVQAHHKDLREFRMQGSQGSDPALQDAIAKGEKIIHDHMVMVDRLARDKGIVTPGHRSNKPTPPPA